MDVRIEKIEHGYYQFSVKLSTDRVESERKKIQTQYRKEAKIPGFRPGKAPINFIEQHFKDAINYKVIDNLAKFAISESLKNKSDIILEKPEVVDIGYNDDQSFYCVFKVLSIPPLPVYKHRGLEINIESLPVTEDDVNMYISSLRLRHSMSSSDTKVTDRGFEKSDIAVIDYRAIWSAEDSRQQLYAHVPQHFFESQYCWCHIPDYSANGAVFFSTLDSFLPGLLSKIEGLLPGEEREIIYSFPDDFKEESLRNQVIHYHVVLHEIHHVTFEELTPELISKIFNIQEHDKLRENIHKILTEERQRLFNQKARDKVIEYLLQTVKTEIPEKFLHSKTEAAVQSILKNQGENVAHDSGDIYQQARMETINNIKLPFIIADIARKERKSVNKRELDNIINEMSIKYNMPPQQVVRQFFGSVDYLRELILFEHVIALILDYAIINGKTKYPQLEMSRVLSKSMLSKSSSEAMKKSIPVLENMKNEENFEQSSQNADNTLVTCDHSDHSDHVHSDSVATNPNQ